MGREPRESRPGVIPAGSVQPTRPPSAPPGISSPIRDTPRRCGRTGRVPPRPSPVAAWPASRSTISFGPITLPGVSRPPAASMPPSSITAPSSTVALMPTKARFFNVQAWITALWPTVTSSPMNVENSPESMWITVPSWMLVRAPMRMEVHVAADQAVEPDAGFRPDHHVTDHRRGGGDEGVLGDRRGDAIQ